MSQYTYLVVLVQLRGIKERILKVDQKHKYKTWNEANLYAIKRNELGKSHVQGTWMAYYE